MNFITKYQKNLKRFVQILAFSAAILVTTAFNVTFGSISDASTVAFCFIIIVLLSAYFGDIVVALTASIVATLCYDYYYLPPRGTFNIAAFSDWVSLAAFLLTSVIISRLTASAAEHSAKAHRLDAGLIHLKEFGLRLLSIPDNQMSLSKIAQETLSVFSLEYCSIHVYDDSKWHHFTGVAKSDVSQKIENQLDASKDHEANLMEIADENMLDVQYIQVNESKSTRAVLVVKTEAVSNNVLAAIAAMLEIRIAEIMKNKKFFNQDTSR